MTAQDVSRAVTAAREVLGCTGPLAEWTVEDIAAAREVAETLLTYAAAAELLIEGGDQP